MHPPWGPRQVTFRWPGRGSRLHGPHLDVVVQGLAILLLELRPDFQHVHFTAGHHDSDQHLITRALALEAKLMGQIKVLPMLLVRKPLGVHSLAQGWLSNGIEMIPLKEGSIPKALRSAQHKACFALHRCTMRSYTRPCFKVSVSIHGECSQFWGLRKHQHKALRGSTLAGQNRQ